MITKHFATSASSKRLSIVSGNKKNFVTHIGSFYCHLQPLDSETRQQFEGSFGKGYLMFSPAIDLKEGDRVTIDLKDYKIMGTERFNFNGKTHRESIISIFE